MAGQVEGEHFKVEIMGLSSAFWMFVVWKRKKKNKGCYWRALTLLHSSSSSAEWGMESSSSPPTASTPGADALRDDGGEELSDVASYAGQTAEMPLLGAGGREPEEARCVNATRQGDRLLVWKRDHGGQEAISRDGALLPPGAEWCALNAVPTLRWRTQTAGSRAEGG